MAAKIRKGARVVVTTGRDKGKMGEVIRMMDDTCVLVFGVFLVLRHQKQTQREQGGIVSKEAAIH